MEVTYVQTCGQSSHICVVSGHLVPFTDGGKIYSTDDSLVLQVPLLACTFAQEKVMGMRLRSILLKNQQTKRAYLDIFIVFIKKLQGKWCLLFFQILLQVTSWLHYHKFETLKWVAEGNWQYQISISIHPLLHQSVQNNLENGNQRKVTAVILGRVLALCAVGS